MKHYLILDDMIRKGGGYLKTSDVESAGVSRVYLSGYVKAQGLKRVAHGLYVSADGWPDGMFVIQHRFEEAAFPMRQPCS
jgi:hypothetical protein